MVDDAALIKLETRGTMRKYLILAFAASAISGCKLGNPNDKPVYAPGSGLPVNCRALITEAVNGWRSGRYTAQDSLESIDRNCGANGYSWNEG